MTQPSPPATDSAAPEASALEARNRELREELARCYEELAALERHIVRLEASRSTRSRASWLARARRRGVRDTAVAVLARLGLEPWKTRHRRAVEVAIVSRSPLFDADWYVNAYPDVAESAMPPAEHYVRHGAEEGRDPGPNFDTLSYLRKHPELRRAQTNPLVHFLSSA